MIQESRPRLTPPLAKPDPLLREAHLNCRPRLIAAGANCAALPDVVRGLTFGSCRRRE
jgi:hypothetical protein